MKLNIDELARHAGLIDGPGDGWVSDDMRQASVSTSDIEAFARLIVERCAAICEEEAAGHGSAFGEHCAIMIRRKLLEAE